MVSNYELVGQKFNRLTVLTQDGVHRNRQKLWLCKCDCGNFSKVTTNALVKNRTKSCGCLRLERLRNSAKHLKTGTVIYRRWCAMKSRCNTSSTSSFEIYGGRGISYAPEWEDFINFYEDMRDGFHPSLELDRIDVNGDYCKENCRWVSHSENNYNKNRQVNNTSGKTGVSYHNKLNKWRAYITIEGVQLHLGLYETIESAVQARREAEIKHYGYERE